MTVQAKLYKTYYDISKLTIWGDNDPDNPGNKPRLVFSFRDGMPRVTVYTGVTGPNGVISAASDYPNFMVVCDLLEEVANGPDGVQYAGDSLSLKWENDKPTNQKYVTGTLYLGKSKEGLVYISVMAEGKPKIVFTLKNSDFHAWRDKNKQPVPESKLSCIMARGFARMFRDILSRSAVDYTNEEYDGGGRNLNVIRANQGSISKASQTAIIESFDDDVPL